MKLQIDKLFALFIWVTSMTSLTAQNGLFDVQFAVKSFNCDSSKVTIAVQVRAHDLAHTFLMGDANYRFRYDPRLIKNPKIVSQEHFSNIAPSSDFNYGAQNLNGSTVGPTKGVVSLNTFYTGAASGAKLVDTAWTNVTCIAFDVVSGTNCFPILWDDNVTFPVTGMNEVTFDGTGNYTLSIVAASGVFGNLNACYQTYCSSLGNPPSVPSSPIVTKQDSTATVCMTITDPDAGSSFTSSLCGAALHGTATPTVVGNQLCVQYVPTTGFTGSDSVCVTVCDNTNRCVNVKIPITVNTIPHAPAVTPIGVTTREDSTVTVCTPISDVDAGSSFTASVCAQGAHGVVTPSVFGSVLCMVYTPITGYSGNDQVCIRVCDNTGLCTNTTIPIVINPNPHPPTFVPVPIVTITDSMVVVCTAITDPDAGSVFTSSVCGAAKHGTTSVRINGSQLCVTYMSSLGYSGLDSVCATVCDNTGLCVSSYFPITVNERQVAPTVIPTSIVTKQDSIATVCMTITDPNAGSSFTNSLCGAALHGTATPYIVGNQLCVQYIPTSGFTGSDSVCVTVCDNTNKCVNVKVPITVNTIPHAPTVAPIGITTREDSAVTVCTPISDIDAGSTFTASVCAQGAHGTVVPSVFGGVLCMIYTPVTGYSGNDQVCIRVCDNTGLCTDATIPIAISPNLHPPTFAPVPIVTITDSTVVVCTTITDLDVGSVFTSSVCGAAKHGTTSMSINGNQLCVTYIPSTGYAGLDSVCATVCDNTGLCASSYFPITVNERQVAPTVIPTSIVTKLDSAVTVCTTIIDPNAGSVFTASLCNTVAGGSVSLLVNNVQLCTRFVPNGSYTGQTSICIHVCDNTGLCTDTNIPVTINPRPHTPILTVSPIITQRDQTATVCMPITDVDPGSSFTASTCSAASHGSATVTVIGSQACVTYIPNAGYVGTDQVCINVCDNTGLCTSQNVPITVIQPQSISLTSTVGIDLNEDGLFDNGELGLANVTVQLYSISDLTTPVATTQTNANGQYNFNVAAPGNYVLKFISPNGYSFTTQNVNNNNNDGNDSDADPNTGFTQSFTLNWGDILTTVTAHFVPNNINPPTITGRNIVSIEDSVLNICIPILDNTPVDVFTPSVCGVQNGTISNVTVVGRQLCFTYTPVFGYRGPDTLCLRVCDRNAQCDTAGFAIDIQAKNTRFSCANDNVPPVITLTNPLLVGVRSGDTLSYNCSNPPIFGVNDAIATDNHDPRPSLNFVDLGVKRGNCAIDGYKVLLECDWRATDSCGNISIIKIFVKITDNVNPVLSSIPANVTVDLAAGQSIPGAPSVTATDNCGIATVALRVDSLPTGQGCDYILVRTWTGTDECGNTVKGVQNVTVLKPCPCSIVAKTVFLPATCGGANGYAAVLLDNVLNYTYNWSANNGISTAANSRSNISSGTYTVTITRNNLSNCQTVVAVTVPNDVSNCCTTPPATAVTSDATCYSSNGTVTINVDVVSNYTYTWSSNNGTGSAFPNVRTNLPAGAYSVTVSRVNQPSCSRVLTFSIGNNTIGCCNGGGFISDTALITAVGVCTSLADQCIVMSNTNIASVTDNGLPYTAGLINCTGGLNVKLPVGSHMMVFKTTTGCTDSVSVKVVCVVPIPLVINTTMIVGTKDSIVLQTDELFGSRFTLRKVSGSTSGSVGYATLPGTMVITRSAVQYGVDNAIYVITDEYGISDTTYITTQVVSRNAARRPLAVDDNFDVLKNKPLTIDVMQNDSIRGILKGVTIISKPKKGTVTLTPDYRVIYTPVSDFCGKDEFTYVLCNNYGCDTAIVQLSVLCEGFKIFNGFSPNGDGVNDYFVIEGIENYPNNVLKIFNRWGNEVFAAKGYQNNWQGTWNGTNLTDGTYFYILDDGEGKSYKGYIQIQR